MASRRWYQADRKRPHHRLRVWHSAKALVLEVYAATACFPDDERFGLTSQLRRATVSVPSNIAEGAGRGTDADFLRFLYIARSSLNEVDTQLEIADELGLFDSIDLSSLRRAFDQTSRELQALIQTIQTTQ